MADLINDMIIISSGQTVSDLNVGKDGWVEVENGGTLATATVNDGGWVTVSSGGTATGIRENGGYIDDKSGAVVTFVANTIDSLELANNQFATVHESTILNSATVNPGAWLVIYSGGSAAGIRENGGYVDDRNGAVVTFAENTIDSLVVAVNQNASIHAPTIVTSTLVTGNGSTGGWLNIFAGANVSGITVTSAGQIDTDGNVSSVTVNASGYINVRGGLMNGATVGADGVAVVYYRGNAWNTTVNNGGRYLIYGGYAAATTVASGGYFVVQEGYEGYESSYDSTFIGGAVDTMITGGTMRVVSGGEVSDVNMIDGYLSAFDRALVEALTMSGGSVLITGTTQGVGTLNGLTMSGGYTEVESGGQINVADVLGGTLMVRAEGTLTDSLICSGGRVDILGSADILQLEGGVATVLGGVTTAVLNSGEFLLSSGAVVTGATVNSGFVWETAADTLIADTLVAGGTVAVGGSASGTVVNQGLFTVVTGGLAEDTSVLYGVAAVDGEGAVAHGVTVGGSQDGAGQLPAGGDPAALQNAALNVLNSGYVENLTVAGGGAANLMADALVKGATTTALDAAINVSSGGVLSEVVVDDGAVNVYEGGVVSGATLNQSARINVSSGGILTGQVTIRDDNDAWVDVTAGGVVHFDLSSATAADPARIDGLKRITGTPTYTLTVDPELAVGSYRLADNAGLFKGSITVRSTTGDELGVIALVSYIQVGTNYYILKTRNGGVDLSISAEIPTLPQSDVYVDTAWAGLPEGTTVEIAGVSAIIGLNAFATADAAADNVLPDGSIYVLGGTVTFAYGITRDTTASSGVLIENSSVTPDVTLTLNSGASAHNLKVEGTATLVAQAGTTLTGCCLWDAESVVTVDGEIVFDVSGQTPETYSEQIRNLNRNTGTPSYSFVIGEDQEKGLYTIATGAAGFSGSISVKDNAGIDVGTLTVGGDAVTYGSLHYLLELSEDGVLSVKAAGSFGPANCDIDGNGISDVMFVWSGYNYQHGYWMNGTDTWQSAGSIHPEEWENLGCYDMTGDGKADSVLIGNVMVSGVKGAYIGYYIDGNDNPDGSTWMNIGYLNNEADIVWKNKVGNLTGNTRGTNSIVWHSTALGALGAWIDGTQEWVTIGGGFDEHWTLVGCGDFDGDGKDSALMTYYDGFMYYAMGIDGSAVNMGNANWSGWEVRAIGDFSGDGKDDIVLFHNELGSMVMLADGNLDNYTSIGQLDANDWFVVGAGDYNGDEQDDLLVRQYSTGMLGYYSGGDTLQWNVLGYGVSMEWTVIA